MTAKVPPSRAPASEDVVRIPPQPQQEYVVTEEQIRDIIYIAYSDYLTDDEIYEYTKDIRSRPHSSAAGEAVRDKMNKLPKGRYCYPDCGKFETKRCPYPGSNITMDYCDSFELRSQQKTGEREP